MSVQYTKLYANGTMLAYGPAAGVPDHLFLMIAAKGADEFQSLEKLLEFWNAAATAPSGVQGKSVLFCPSFDPATLKAALDRLTDPGSGSIGACWGTFKYWRQAPFSGGPPDQSFPSTFSRVIKVGEFGLDATIVPRSLDDFRVDPNGDDLSLTLRDTNATWSVDDQKGVEGSLTVSLGPADGGKAGAVGMKLAWPDSTVTQHPARRAAFHYVAASKQLPGPGIPSAPNRVFVSQFTPDGNLAVPGTCRVFLDPRDSEQAPNWLNGDTNSRLLFDDTQIPTCLRSQTSDRFVLQRSSGASGRLGFVFDRIKKDSTLASSGKVVFHPEGVFSIISPASSAGSFNLKPRDLVAGPVSTEYFDANDATHLEFVRGPAFLREDETGDPDLTQRKLLSKGQNQLVVTSHVRFIQAGQIFPAGFCSRPAEAPLFGNGTAHLLRDRSPFGLMPKQPPTDIPGMPLFPRAGYQSTGSAGDQDLAQFETTHFAQFRRNHVERPTVAAHALAAVPGETLFVTPQGLLAGITNGTYTHLYFGNPDSSNPKPDFAFQINAGGDPSVYNRLSQALAGHQLFMVFRNPTPQALQVISPALVLNARDFTFSVGPSSSSGPMNAQVVFIKYFTGASIEELIKDTGRWACQSDLAPNGVADRKDWNPFEEGTVPKGFERLHSVWQDPRWQGVLVLDFPVSTMPDVLEALRPGLFVQPGQTSPVLRVQFFGLDAVPVQSKDLAQPQPQRPGSAWGMIKYTHVAGQDPKPPQPGDTPPSEADQSLPSYTYMVQSLLVVFENSQIAQFTARVTVGYSHLFWEPPLAGKQIELDGSYQRKQQPDGSTLDVFSLVSPQNIDVTFDSSCLKRLTITQVELLPTVVRAPDRRLLRLTAFVHVKGKLEFNEGLVKNLPLFTVKSIEISDFGFSFDYDVSQADPQFSFRFSVDRISADIDFNASDVSKPPFLSMLPIRLTGMKVALLKLLDLVNDLHFQALDFGGVFTTGVHFAFLFELDLGSLGQLAGDLRGIRIPMIAGWRTGKTPAFSFGIQFPTFQGKIDIGIQQFIRLQADSLALLRCTDSSGNISAMAIQLVGARVVMLGKAWPDQDVSLAIFIPTSSGRKASWAFGVRNGDSWYVGGGYRINVGANQPDVMSIEAEFEKNLTGKQVCDLLPLAVVDSDNWSVVGKFTPAKGDAGFEIGVAVSDPRVYGVHLNIIGFPLDLLYRRINSQLGVFSIEFSFPAALRTIQIGVATVRLPVLRVEVYTDGGFLVDFGFPWNNDFSRSCQVEIAIFLGSGGFYYGQTSAAASDLLRFTDSYGFRALDPNDKNDSAVLNSIRTIRMGFAARVGIGRSFSIGILSAQASLTIFGGIEGAAGYAPGQTDPFTPTLYALRGFMGLMVDIRASVDFAIIRAEATIQVYAEVGLEIRRVIAKKGPGEYHLLTLPVVIFAEVGINITVTVEISIGCVSVTFHLSFSAKWRIQETLGDLSHVPYQAPHLMNLAPTALAKAAAVPFAWNPAFRYWKDPRSLTLYATVLPCMAQTADLGGGPGTQTCVVGTALAPVRPKDNGFGDLAKFLVAQLLLDPGNVTGNPGDYSALRVNLDQVTKLRTAMATQGFWTGFPAAILGSAGNQFSPTLNLLANGQDEPFSAMPLWPGTTFEYTPATGEPVKGTPSVVLVDGSPMSAQDAAFVDYCRQFIAGTIPEIQLLLQEEGTLNGVIDPAVAPLVPNDPARALQWDVLWQKMFALDEAA